MICCDEKKSIQFKRFELENEECNFVLDAKNGVWLAWGFPDC